MATFHMGSFLPPGGAPPVFVVAQQPGPFAMIQAAPYYDHTGTSWSAHQGTFETPFMMFPGTWYQPVPPLVQAGLAVVETPPYAGTWYQIVGDGDAQMLEVAIPPGGEFVTEPSAVVHQVREHVYCALS